MWTIDGPVQYPENVLNNQINLEIMCIAEFGTSLRNRYHACKVKVKSINSSPLSAAYMRQGTGPALAQAMTCRLFGAKPLPEPMLAYCHLVSWEWITVKFESEFCHFHSGKCIWKCRLPQWRPFCPGWDELITRLASYTWLSTTINIKNSSHCIHFVPGR